MDNNFLDQVVYRLSTNGTYLQGPDGFRLRCPNSACEGEAFVLSKADGSAVCFDEKFEGGFRRFSPEEIAELLGIPVDDPAKGKARELPVRANFGALRTSQVARYLGISERWLRRAEQQGKIPPAGRDLRGHRYYTPEDLAALEKILHTNTDWVLGDDGHQA